MAPSATARQIAHFGPRLVRPGTSGAITSTHPSMRLAVSGAHATGKTTLINELSRHLAGHRVVDEPYYMLLDEGHAFEATPSPDDFERMLERSLAAVDGTPGGDVLFDRCAGDYLAYLAALGAGSASLAPWISRVAESVAGLERVVFIPVERPDRVPGAELPGLRRRVDHVLREMWMDDAWGIGARVLEVRGSVADRVRQVLAAVSPGIRH